MESPNSIEMMDFTIKNSGDIEENSGKTSTKVEPYNILIKQQRDNFRLFSQFIIIFILGCAMLFNNLTATFTCTDDSLLSCFPQFHLQVVNSTETSSQVLETTQECLKMISYFSTSFLSSPDSQSQSSLLSPFLGSLGGLWGSSSSSTDSGESDKGSVLSRSVLAETGSVNTNREVAELGQSKPTFIQLKPNENDLNVERIQTRNVLGGLDLVVNTPTDGHEVSEATAVRLLHVLEFVNKFLGDSSDTETSSFTSPFQLIVDHMLSNVDNVLESKGLLNVIDTISEDNRFYFNHNGYCKVNQVDKKKFCSYSNGLDIFAVFIQDIGLQLGNLTHRNDTKELSASMVLTFNNAVNTFYTIYHKALAKEEGYTDLDVEKLSYSKSLHKSRRFSTFSANATVFIIILSIASTLAIGNALLSFTVENVKFFDWIQLNLGRYVLKIIASLIITQEVLYIIVLWGELSMLKKYTRIFNSLEIARFRPSWGFYFTILNVVFAGVQVYFIYIMNRRHVKL
jgi:hypothetical protein